jgi:GNAT superfamily N-acetyltransferase
VRPRLRPAEAADVPALTRLIESSARGLSADWYTPRQIDAAVRYVFGVDSALIDDGTYYVVTDGEAIVACGGWSRRRTLYGGDQRKVGHSGLLDPRVDAARIRAFFVAPAHVRLGLGRMLLSACEAAARDAGFSRLELMATLPGVPFYERAGFVSAERTTDVLPDGTAIDFVRMTRDLD